MLPRVTKEEVEEHFKEAGGTIVRVTLMTRQKTAKDKVEGEAKGKGKARGKGYGFIEFSDAAAYTVSYVAKRECYVMQRVYFSLYT